MAGSSFGGLGQSNCANKTLGITSVRAVRMPPRTSAMRSGAVTLVCKSNGSKVRTPDTTPLPELTRQKWFSDCGHVKWDSDLSVQGHGSLRCRVLRFKMVFGGGSSPMSFAGRASEPTPQPFLRDRSTSVPSGLRFPPSQRRKFRSGSSLLCPLIVRARFPDRQDQDCDLARCCDWSCPRERCNFW